MFFPRQKLFYYLCLAIPLFFLVSIVQAQASVTIDGLVYTLNGDSTATLNGYAETCPNTVDISTITYNSSTYTVTGASGWNDFSNCSNLTSVNLPEVITVSSFIFQNNSALTTLNLPKVTSIGLGSFSDSSALTVLNLPELTTLGNGAFARSTSLQTASLPKVTNIGDSAFQSCTALKSLTLGSVPTGYTYTNYTGTTPPILYTADSAGYYASNYNWKNSWHIDDVNTEEVISQNNLFYIINQNGTARLIGYDKNASCPESLNLSEITFENETYLLTTVDFSALENCNDLISINFPEVTEVGYGAFYGCLNLTIASLPKVTLLGSQSFDETSLNSLTLNHIFSEPAYSTNFGNYNGSLPRVIYTNYPEEFYSNNNVVVNGDWYINDLSKEEVAIYNDLYYIINNSDNTARLIGRNTSQSCPVILNDSIITANNKTYTVVSVGNEIFSNCADLTTISLSAVTQIGYKSFSDCFNLTSVFLPKLTTVGIGAFSGAASLTSISLPKLTDISNGAFASTQSSGGGGSVSVVPQSTIFTALKNFLHLNVFAIESGDTGNICGLITADFPEALIISPGAFFGCQQLSSVNLPKATEINDNAFSDCINLTEIIFPQVTTLGEESFAGCTNLSTVELPKMTEVGYGAFFDTSSLTTISFPELITVGDGAFSIQDNSVCALTTVNLPKATTIGDWAFSSCTALSSVNLPRVTALGAWAFQDCPALTEISLPELVTIGEEAFAPYSETCSLTKASFPRLDSVGNLAFANCNSFNSLTLGHLPTNTASDAFSGYTSESPRNLYTNFTSEYSGSDWNGWIINDLPRTTVTNLSYALDPNSQTAILSGYDTEIGCPTAIDSSSVNYNSQTYEITTVDDNAFSNCPHITTVNLPKVTNVGSYAFSPETENVAYFSPQVISRQLSRIFKPQVAADSLGDVCSITSLNLPEALIINEGAFKDCSLLTSINLPQATTIGVEAFAGGTSLTTASLPQLTVLDDRAFNNCSTFNSLTLGHLPTTVGSDVFAGYTNSAPRNLYTLYASEYPSDNWYGWIINQLAESENDSDNQTDNQTTSIQSFSTNYSSPGPASAPSCGATIPSGTPKIFQIQRQGESAVLYLEPGDSSFKGQYHLMFGFKKGEQRFGALSAQVIDGSGAEKMIVHNLDPKANYWFTVAPVNGCAVGNWSNWAQSKATQKVWHLFNK